MWLTCTHTSYSNRASKIIARLLPEGRSRFSGTSNNVGANAGLLYWHPGLNTRFGLNYRSVVQHFTGKASFAFDQGYALQPVLGISDLTKLFPTQTAHASFPTPATYGAGIATEAITGNLFSLEVQMQDFHRLEYVVFNFTQTQGTATPAEQRLAFSFHNATSVRYGWERKIKQYTIRAGGAYDQTPVPDKSVGPLWPDSSRFDFTIGASKLFGGSREFSAFYKATKFLVRTINVPANANVFTNGEYNNFGHLFGFSVRFRTGGKPVEFMQ